MSPLFALGIASGAHLRKTASAGDEVFAHAGPPSADQRFVSFASNLIGACSVDYLFDRFESLQKEPGYHENWKDVNLAAQVRTWDTSAIGRCQLPNATPSLVAGGRLCSCLELSPHL
jgi:hypothetical protein